MTPSLSRRSPTPNSRTSKLSQSTSARHMVSRSTPTRCSMYRSEKMTKRGRGRCVHAWGKGVVRVHARARVRACACTRARRCVRARAHTRACVCVRVCLHACVHAPTCAGEAYPRVQAPANESSLRGEHAMRFILFPSISRAVNALLPWCLCSCRCGVALMFIVYEKQC